MPTMDTPVTFANADVLTFYREMPFNYWQNADAQSDEIGRVDLGFTYPTLVSALHDGIRVLEVGCGVGWLSSHIARTHACRVTAIDFNPTAIERARAITERLHTDVDFQTADLFTYEPSAPYPVVVSIGVLHHTNNCLEGLRRCFATFAAEDADVFVGLYHLHGRRPFLSHFRKLREEGMDEEELFAEYARLHNSSMDRTGVYSWFRDQVLHPHETQHTLREVVELGAEHGFELLATSLNEFRPVVDLAQLYAREIEQEQLGKLRLNHGRYFPGFFLAHLRRRAAQRII
jgi:cyclopropane fatty-acyl-phospholipid synthase-like methyltransferase